MSTPLCNYGVSKLPLPPSFNLKHNYPKFLSCRKALQIHVNATNEVDAQTGTVEEEPKEENLESEPRKESKSISSATSTTPLDKDLKKVVQKTAATFAPRASTATKNPAVPGTTLYTVFEVQGYVSLLLGGALSFNLIFPSNEPDIWRLMGMWSIWMFTIPSLRARDCSKNEKEALNYLFLIIPLLNVIIPFFWKSFAVVWSADIVAFFAILDGYRKQSRNYVHCDLWINAAIILMMDVRHCSNSQPG
ncbi:hypothetical protein Golax_023943 [Gossypium laxum]|uniref:Uncharacterized protein n=3 Tax=Gossypium TaxID=3633 RepID=A0A7J9IVA5_9ROSI|nr:hypothetical protein [Gossypium lobatum]MBA0708858.1 hypothetical protein [Gossypium laxum]MBA0826027.1 hypothetical protein [Gossypium armourianum]